MTENDRHGMTYTCAHVVGVRPERAPQTCPYCGDGEQTKPIHEWEDRER